MTEFFGLLVVTFNVIGHGPSAPGKFSDVIMLILGIMFAAGAVHPKTRLRAAFSHGKGPSVPVGSAGRVILFLLALVLSYEGARGLLQ